ncbi:MAG TPA: hypothetical protein VFA81_05755 [Burkholderiales bacterium]|nr:hypothetical protein [Burkholderiales bacterium]
MMELSNFTLLAFLGGRRKQCRTPAKAMATRSMVILGIILIRRGSAFRAAVAGEINAEEYLRLEGLWGH